MRVLHFGRFYNDNFGGLERHVANLLDGLSSSIHVANVVANERFGLDVIELPRYKVYKAPSLGPAREHAGVSHHAGADPIAGGGGRLRPVSPPLSRPHVAPRAGGACGETAA